MVKTVGWRDGRRRGWRMEEGVAVRTCSAKILDCRDI